MLRNHRQSRQISSVLKRSWGRTWTGSFLTRLPDLSSFVAKPKPHPERSRSLILSEVEGRGGCLGRPALYPSTSLRMRADGADVSVTENTAPQPLIPGSTRDLPRRLWDSPHKIPACAGMGGSRSCHPGKGTALIRDPVSLGPGFSLRCGRDDMRKDAQKQAPPPSKPLYSVKSA